MTSFENMKLSVLKPRRVLSSGLFVIYSHHPYSSAVATQNTRFLEALMNSGINIIPVVKQIRSTPYPTNFISVRECPKKVISHLLRRTIKDLAFLPDLESYLWAPAVKRRLKKTLSLSDVHWVHTSNSPFASHLIGAWLKKQYNKPWVAQFYDPWVDNTYRSYDTPLAQRYNRYLEAKIAEEADLIIHTNDIIKDRWVSRYGSSIEEKIVVIPLCTDKRIVKNESVPKTKNEKLVLIHAGGIYGLRKLNTFIEALVALSKKGIPVESLLEVRLIGKHNSALIRSIEGAGLNHIIQAYPSQTYDQIQKQLDAADVHLLIEAAEVQSVFFPSKLCEYFSYQKPIIGLTAKDSPGFRMLKESGHLQVEVSDLVGIERIMERVLVHRDFPKYDKNFYKRFLPDTVAEMYIQALKEKNIL